MITMNTVKRLRRANGWSQRQLAEAADVSLKTIQRLEKGHEASLETLAAIANVFHVSVSELEPTKHEVVEADKKPSASILGQYGPLLAAVTDALKEVHHWRQHFNDLFMFRGFFLRKPDPPLFESLESQAHLASTVSIQLHQDIAEGIRQLKKLDYEVQSFGGHIRNLSRVGYHVTPDVQKEGSLIGNALCDHIEFYLGRAKKELVARVFPEHAA
jgi:transcriptional regulator with XRE-family HTH domain